MNIEEPIKRLKLHSENTGLCLNGGTTCMVNISDLDWLLTAYEKEKEQNNKLLEALDTVNHEKGVFIESYEKEKETSHYNQSQLDIANAKLVEEKEKNKNKDNILRNIREEFLKYDWKDANPIQTYNQIKSLYESIYCKPYED